jgi:hypothetical protein
MAATGEHLAGACPGASRHPARPAPSEEPRPVSAPPSRQYVVAGEEGQNLAQGALLAGGLWQR